MKMPNEIDFLIVLVICGSVLATAQVSNEYFDKSVKLFENITEQLESLRNDSQTSTLKLHLQNGILYEDLMKGNADLFHAMSRYANEAKNANLTKILNLVQTQLETLSNTNTTADHDMLQVVLNEVRAIKNEQLNKTCYSINDNETVVQPQLTELLNEVTKLKKANNALVSVSKSRWKKQQKLLRKILKSKSNQTNNQQQPGGLMPGFDNSSLKLPRSCAEALERAGKDAASGIYQLYLPYSGLNPFFVYCLRDRKGGPAWTIVQRRADNTTNFYRDWAEYKVGFGNLNNEFFIGLDKLHALTQYEVQELWVHLEDFENETRYAKYNSFAIGDKHQNYALTILGDYEGDAGDSLRFQEGHMFSTRDRDHDTSKRNCAYVFKGAWWYSHCHASNLNGVYLKGAFSRNLSSRGVVWRTWHGFFYSLRRTHMAIRPKNRRK